MRVCPKVAAFDIIGTTFSLDSVHAPLIEAGFPDHVLETWFARTLRDAFAMAATDTFAPFRSLFAFNLEELARAHSVEVKAELKEAILGHLSALSPHEDARQAFELLGNSGIRIVALSNGAFAASQKLLEAGRLAGLVERVVSVEEISAFKPDREVYRHTVKVAGVAPEEAILVATHPWDIHGAKRAGLMAAFVARGQKYPPMFQAPDVVGESLLDVAMAIIA